MSDDNNFYMYERIRLETEKLRQRAQSDEMRRDTAFFLAGMKERAAERIQDRKEALTREGWLRDDERRRLDDEIKRLEMASQVMAERIKGENAIALATHNANIAVQQQVYGIHFDNIRGNRDENCAITAKFLELYKSIAQEIINDIIQTDRRNDEFDKTLELERVKLEYDLIRAERAHEHAIGRENAQRQQETFLAVLQSRLRNEEVSHAEIVRLIVRMIEGARAGGNAKDAEKWAADCFDEWERERKYGRS